MIQANLKPHESNARLNVLLLDEELFCIIDPKVIHSNLLDLPKQFNSKKEFETFWHEKEFKAVKAYAIRRLARRAFNSFELEKIFERHFVSDKTSHLVLAHLKEDGFIDDPDWISSFVQKEIRRNSSPRMIAEKLKLKQVPKKFIDIALKKYYPPSVEEQVLIGLIEKELEKYRMNETLKNRQKLIARLVRKGFSLQDVYSLLNNLKN